MNTPLAPSVRRPSLLLALAAAVLAGCGGHGSGGGSSSAGPSIKTQPTSTAAVAGSSVTLSVSATGSGLTYQWFKNGGQISGATSATYTIASVSTGSVATYYVTITDGSGAVTTSNQVTVTLAASDSPTITTQPVNLTVAPGGTATFSVTASGLAPLTYQWYKLVSGTGTAISGATSATYAIANVADTDAGSYYVVVTNAKGSATSNTVSLATSASAPTISQQPLSQTIGIGSTASFTVSATGVGTLTYQWYKVVGGVATPISGATGATYSISAVDANSAGGYYVVVSSGFGQATSSTATLTVVTTPVITQQPTATSVKQGGTTTLTVVASGVNLTYRWYHNGVATSATSSTYTISSATTADAGSYYCVVSNLAGSAQSNAATVTVLVPPVIVTQPTSQVVGVGSAATFSVQASSPNTGDTLSYQWYDATTNVAISGATSASYTTAATTSALNATKYYVQVTNSGGTTTSSTVTLQVDQPPVISSQPGNQSVTHGNAATFQVTASVTDTTVTHTLYYQWYRNGVALTNGTSNGATISGATTATLTYTPGSTADSGTTYYVIVYNDSNTSTANVKSNTVTLTVN